MNTYCLSCMDELAADGSRPSCSHANSPSPLPHQLVPGTVLKGRFLIGRALGQGGFGITYLGRDLTLNLKIAVKEFFPSSLVSRQSATSSVMVVNSQSRTELIERGKGRFLKEAQVLASLDGNEGVVDVRDFFEANNTAYIVMEYLEGIELIRHIQGSTFGAEDIFRRFLPIADSLAQIHARGIIHRDISPENIMMLRDGSLKLMDFGAARELTPDSQASMTIAAVFLHEGGRNFATRCCRRSRAGARQAREWSEHLGRPCGQDLS